MKAVLLFAFCLPPVWCQQAGSRPFKLEELKTPPGYEVSVYARVSGSPRHMTIGPNGVLYVAAPGNGTVVAIPEAGQTVVVLRGLNQPHTPVFRDGSLYVSLTGSVQRFDDAVQDDLVVRSAGQTIMRLPSGGQHTTRTVGLSPDGFLFVSVGSSCNFCVETDSRRAAILRFNLDGTGQMIYAKGLRNSVGLAWHPVTGDLWAGDNGGDGLGDNEPPEEINIVTENGDYGWPDCVGSQRPAPWGAQARPQRCGATTSPELEMQAHSAPVGLSFYTGDAFPVSFRNDALLTFHGSWNRLEPTGYKVVRIRAASGHAAGIEDFLWGFLDSARRNTSGRPVYAVTAPDGSVFVSDDMTGNIYRVEYRGPRIDDGGITLSQDGVYSIVGKRLVVDPALVQVFVNGLSAGIVQAVENKIDFVMPDVHGDVTVTVKNEVAADDALITVE